MVPLSIRGKFRPTGGTGGLGQVEGTQSEFPAHLLLFSPPQPCTDRQNLSGTLGDDRLDASSGVAVAMTAVVQRK